MTNSTKKNIVLLASIGVVVSIAASVFWQKRPPDSTPTPAPEVPGERVVPGPLVFSASPYLNTQADAHYVGAAACVGCHRNNHHSYLLTPHSRALADLDPKVEPPDAAFQHKLSGRHYRIYRAGREFRHEEVARTAEGKEIARVDLPVRYLIGSGNFCRSYLVEVDGFLHESPVTWYTGRKKWDMSPGYDFPEHWSFERPVKLGCLACHAGRVEAQGNAVNRLRIQEQSIGCESCHGPGSKHVALRKPGQPVLDDVSIVNPGRLARPHLEAVCAACHLSGVATVHLRGRSVTDFRPGMPLTDYRVDYRFDVKGDTMSVVGHIEQLRLSPCYQKSDLTCLTCHDQHAAQKPKDATAYFRQKCVQCHTTMTCKLDPGERIKKDGSDNCVACHMPRGDTDIPHIAFHHHRIGRHAARAPLPAGIPDVVPIDDDSHLPVHDRQRNLGLAYLQVANKADYAHLAGTYRQRARALLETVNAAGLNDGETLKALAELYWQNDLGRTKDFARRALLATDLPADARAVAMLLLADSHLQEKDINAAVTVLEELVRLRRYSEDWRLLAHCYVQRREPQKAVHALKTALSIRPFRHDLHGAISEVYGQIGDKARASEHLEKARWLHAHAPQ